MSPPSDITTLLMDWDSTDENARENLLQLIYPELKEIARRRLAGVGRAITLDSVDLLHETYLRMVDQRVATWESRQHFFCVAARLVRRVLLDHLRRRNRLRRGGVAENLPLDEVTLSVKGTDIDLLALDQAIERLEKVDATAARVVELRYFAGMGHTETAESLSIGRATVGRHWRFAKAFLAVQLQTSDDAEPEFERHD